MNIQNKIQIQSPPFMQSQGMFRQLYKKSTDGQSDWDNYINFTHRIINDDRLISIIFYTTISKNQQLKAKVYTPTRMIVGNLDCTRVILSQKR